MARRVDQRRRRGSGTAQGSAGRFLHHAGKKQTKEARHGVSYLTCFLPHLLPTSRVSYHAGGDCGARRRGQSGAARRRDPCNAHEGPADDADGASAAAHDGADSEEEAASSFAIEKRWLRRACVERPQTAHRANHSCKHPPRLAHFRHRADDVSERFISDKCSGRVWLLFSRARCLVQHVCHSSYRLWSRG